MRKLLTLLLVLWATSAQAAIAVGVHASATSGTTVAVTTGVTTQASGSIFFVVGCSTGTYAATPVTDSKTNTYTTIQLWTPSFGVNCVRAQTTNGTGGATHTFTATTTASATSSIWATEVTGGATSLAIDQSAKGNDAATPFDSPNTATLAQANEILLGFAVDNSSGGTCTYGGANGFTIIENVTNSSASVTGALSWKVVASTAADHSSFTDTGCGATQMDVAVDTFKQAGGGGGATTAPPCGLRLLGVGC